MGASVAAQDGQNGQAAYGAAKGGIVSMTLPMARDLGKRGIRVNTIMPGVFETPMTAPMKKQAPHLYKNLTSSNVFPNTRLGLPNEFGHMAVAILENKYLNGKSVLTVVFAWESFERVRRSTYDFSSTEFVRP